MPAHKRVYAPGEKRAYAVWSQMKQRCHSKGHRCFKNYGARGVVVCDRWRNSFAAFWADMGPPPDDGKRYSIDRRENDGPYSPGNCRWATYSQQLRNTRKTVRATIDGVTRPVIEWAETLGVKYGTVQYRIYEMGMTPERALTESLGGRIRVVTHGGRSMCLKDWCRVLKKSYGYALALVNKGVDPLIALGLVPKNG